MHDKANLKLLAAMLALIGVALVADSIAMLIARFGG